MSDPPIAPAVAAIRAGNFEQARKLCEELLAKNPNDFAASSTLCYLCIESDQRDAAERIIAQLRARNDLTARQRCEVANRIFETGRIGEAVSWLGGQVADDPRGDASIFCQRGLLQERWGDYPGAADSYAHAAERDPAYDGVGERLRQFREHIQRNDTLSGNVDRIGRAIAEKLGDAVLTGPFKGMKFAPNIDISWAAELVGRYEQDLHPILEALIASGHQTIIDIGASGGYYAAGMAMRCPQAKVIGYEMDPARRAACEQVAHNNHVRDRLDLRGECTRAELLSLGKVPQPTLIICDCEGAELDLLQPGTIPLVRRSDVLVEVHDFILPRLERRLLVRFAPTHTITRIAAIAPFPDSYKHLLPFLSPEDLQLAVSDFRPVGMTWLALRPIQKAN